MPDERPISEETPIRLKFVVLLVGAIITILGGLSGTVWWAATVSEKLSTIVVQQAAIVAQQTAFREQYTQTTSRLTSDLTELQSWRKMIDQQGDPAGRVRCDALEKEINLLRHDLDVEKAKAKP